MRAMVRKVLVCMALAGVVAGGPAALRAGEAEPEARLSVSGHGSVAVAPDMATVSVGVEHQAPGAREAMGRVSGAVAAVLARLEAAGVEARDMQTSGLGLSPVHDYGDNGPPRLVGFRASNRVTVRIRDLARLGAVLDAVIADGANRIDGLSFGVAEPAPLRDEARAGAVADARHRAEVLAEAAGMTLGPLVSLSEAGGGVPVPMAAMRMAEAAPPVPVVEGEVEITADVQMVFQIIQ